MGSPGGSPSGRVPAEQRAGLAAALRPHRGTGALGGSQFRGGGHDPHLWPSGQSQSAGRVPGADPADCRGGSAPMARLGIQALCRRRTGAWRRINPLQLQPWRLAGDAGGSRRADAASGVAADPPLATPLASPAASRPAGAGGRGDCLRCHASGPHPNPRGQPAGRTRRQLQQLPHQRLAGGDRHDPGPTLAGNRPRQCRLQQHLSAVSATEIQRAQRLLPPPGNPGGNGHSRLAGLRRSGHSQPATRFAGAQRRQ